MQNFRLDLTGEGLDAGTRGVQATPRHNCYRKHSASLKLTFGGHFLPRHRDGLGRAPGPAPRCPRSRHPWPPRSLCTVGRHSPNPDGKDNLESGTDLFVSWNADSASATAAATSFAARRRALRLPTTLLTTLIRTQAVSAVSTHRHAVAARGPPQNRGRLPSSKESRSPFERSPPRRKWSSPRPERSLLPPSLGVERPI